ncbi:hypothetical protein XFF6992_140110 [Xanthomonas citri pv. fuscans]|nr:hypothetical protein XFF6992_140110 [Xanthomonas citri pv. fuscans]SOO35289.1 hypothetical protein XFF6994_520004 [Xanthomonas citri pv. fuscans]
MLHFCFPLLSGLFLAEIRLSADQAVSAKKNQYIAFWYFRNFSACLTKGFEVMRMSIYRNQP